jgi:hypothetical protein
MTMSGVADGFNAKVFLRSRQVRRRGETIEVNCISMDVAYSK